MKKINVTQPDLPPLNEFSKFLEEIWNKKILTNMGDFHNELEKKLCEYLGVKYISLFNNGTTALLTALKVLNITKEVITTPYSFVATSHVLKWNNITPVFVDIEEKTCNLDPKKIERAITDKTEAILPVHIYGNPCDVKVIQQIAEKYKLKVIYDACHAFGVKLQNKSVLSFGNLSVISFHATKVFNTFEGGAIVSQSAETKSKIDRLKNFGFVNETTVEGIGINGKMNEFQAAFGLAQLNYIDQKINERKRIAHFYRERLKKIDGITFLSESPGVKYNFAYFPIFVDEKKYGISRDELYNNLKNENIYIRRYFYPLISQFPAYQNLNSSKAENLPVAEKLTKQVICLPLYSNLQQNELDKIIGILNQN
jgi:dTDP-4-amino-4,6-dideoxygalactose transaminase